MSTPGRPKGELLPLGGTARNAKGAPVSPPGRPGTPVRAGRSQGPQGPSASTGGGRPHGAANEARRGGGPTELLPPGGTARSAKGAHQ